MAHCAFLLKWLHRLNAKRLSLPFGKECLFTARFSGYPILMGWVRKSLRLRKNPLYSVMPKRNRLHKSEHPICANAALIKSSCFSKASANEQLGVSSCSECFNNSPNSSVTNGRLAMLWWKKRSNWPPNSSSNWPPVSVETDHLIPVETDHLKSDCFFHAVSP